MYFPKAHVLGKIIPLFSFALWAIEPGALPPGSPVISLRIGAAAQSIWGNVFLAGQCPAKNILIAAFSGADVFFLASAPLFPLLTFPFPFGILFLASGTLRLVHYR